MHKWGKGSQVYNEVASSNGKAPVFPSRTILTKTIKTNIFEFHFKDLFLPVIALDCTQLQLRKKSGRKSLSFRNTRVKHRWQKI